MGSRNPGISKKAILVVEDEYLIALNLQLALEDADATVIGPFAHIDKALGELEMGARPDAAVLDINVGERMVFPVAERLKRLGIPFVFASGYDAWTIPAAFSDVKRFEKPTGCEDLIAALSAMIAAEDERRAL